METTIMGYIRVILGLDWGYIGIIENKMEAITLIATVCMLQVTPQS